MTPARCRDKFNLDQRNTTSNWLKTDDANTSTRQHVNTSTRQHVNTSTRQHVNTSTRQHVNTKAWRFLTLSKWIFCLFLWLVYQTTIFGQSVVDLDGEVEIRFDGKSEVELSIDASLIDGFTYRLPVKLMVGDGVKLDDLSGKTICQCASLQFDKKRVGDEPGDVSGQILLRPKSADLAQTLDAFGTRPGELDPVRIGRVYVNCKVFSPLRFVPAVIEVKDKRFPVSSIALRVSKGVEIVEAKMSDSNSVILAVFESDKNEFRIDLGDAQISDDQGELHAEFVVKYKGKKANYVASIPYAPKPTARVIPSTVTFRLNEGGCVGRLIVIGFGPAETQKPSLLVEKQSKDGTWNKTSMEFAVDHFGFGKAIGRLILPSDQAVVATGSRTRLRLTDKVTSVVVVEFESLLLE